MTLPAPARFGRPGRFASLALADLARQGAEIGVVTLPAPATELDRFPLPRDGAGFFWDPPRGPRLAAAGAALVCEARGAERFAELRARLPRLWRRIGEARHPEVTAPPLRLLAGFSFVPGGADDPPWRGFGDAMLALPRVTYGLCEGSGFLRIAVRRPGDRRTRAQVAREVDALLSSPERPAEARGGDRPGADLAVSELAPETWRRRVESIRTAIRAGACEKIVTARRSRVTAKEPFDPGAVLAELGHRHPDCYRFAFRRDGATFLGATPERLVARRRDRVETEALAGTVAVGGPAAAARLLESRKDRGEQELVVRAIERELAPRCESLDIPAEPRIRALRHMLHLETPVRGRLRRPTHILELVEALHPTPAVGGEPTARALSWIAGQEGEPRGWYAAPVGWLDAEGDGEFAVAIRSGLVRGRRAWVWAGAGIVGDSEPDSEYAETGHKQRALFEALGVRR